MGHACIFDTNSEVTEWFCDGRSKIVPKGMYLYHMAKKGKEKNTKNKAKHSKLMDRKKNKLKKEQQTRKEKLKAIIQNAKKNDDSV